MASSGRVSHDVLPRATGGLRERKKRKTRDAIRREAMRLFQEQGYEATTIEQIAEAAEVSPSTFFNYFPTKEDVLIDDGNDRVLAARVAARPGDEPLGVAIRRALTEWVAGSLERDREMLLMQGRIGLEVPAVRARIWEEMEKGCDLILAVIAERSGRDPGEFELRVEALVVMTALTSASLEWVRTGGCEDLEDLVDRALAVVEAGARLDATATAKPATARV